MKYIIIIYILLVFSVISIAQDGEKTPIHFADKVILHSSYGYFPYSGDNDLVINIRYWDNQVFLSINDSWFLGLNYYKVWTSDFFKNKLDFFRVGPIIKWQESAYDGDLIYYADISLNYGNFIINLQDEPEKRNLLFAGGCFGLDYRLVSKLFISGGARFSRQLEKGDYGLELYPFVGFSFRY